VWQGGGVIRELCNIVRYQRAVGRCSYNITIAELSISLHTQTFLTKTARNAFAEENRNLACRLEIKCRATIVKPRGKCNITGWRVKPAFCMRSRTINPSDLATSIRPHRRAQPLHHLLQTSGLCCRSGMSRSGGYPWYLNITPIVYHNAYLSALQRPSFPWVTWIEGLV
jgi:hypothetical protein